MAAAIAEPPHLAADLKALCLSTVAAQWQPLAEQAVRQRQGPADYLAQLVHLEVAARRERRIQDARFPMLKTLDAFSFEAQPDLDRDAVLQVAYSGPNGHGHASGSHPDSMKFVGGSRYGSCNGTQ